MAGFAPNGSYKFLEVDERYESLRRPCDDPYINFERIKTHHLWVAREGKSSTKTNHETTEQTHRE